MKGTTTHTDGIHDVISAVHAFEAAEKARNELAAALAEAEARVEQARLRLAQFAGLAGSAAPAPVKASPENIGSAAAEMPEHLRAILQDESLAICWRIAKVLVEDPVLNYQATAEILYGPDVDKGVAKNRVNSHVSALKKLGVVTALGSNHHEVDKVKLAEKLAELSGLPLPGEAAQ